MSARGAASARSLARKYWQGAHSGEGRPGGDGDPGGGGGGRPRPRRRAPPYGQRPPRIARGPQLRWCRGGDLNPYDLAVTSPSSWRVYLFRHLGSDRAFAPAGSKRDEESTTPLPEVKHWHRRPPA